MKKNLYIYTLIFILILGIFSSFSFAEDEEIMDSDGPVFYFEKGKVLEVEDKHMEGDFSYDYQLVKTKILTGEYKGEIVEFENAFTNNIVYDLPVKANDTILLSIEKFDDGSREICITDYARDNVVKILIAGFLILLVLIGKGKGFKSVITITLTVFSIIKIFLPLILKGYNPLILTILISSIITIMTILIVSGVHKKSFSAILGTIFGVIIAGIISIVASKVALLTGLTTEEAGMLMNLPQNIDFDFKSLLFSGIILGALGAVMDVAMSIASSIQEIHNANNNLSIQELFKSGMEVGRDIMGTMSNTLILAYTGSFIPLLLLFMAYGTPFARLINMDIIATEIIRSLAGSIGLILTIPITAIFSVTFLKRDEFN